MKLSNLSLAILVAMGVAACGGSDNNDAPQDPQTPQQPGDDNNQPKPQAPADTVVDPTKTGVVGKLDLKTESSVGTTQYIRGDKSRFDRSNNPSEKTAATAILGVTLDKQNPYLTNFAAAKLVSKDGKVTVVQHLGNPGKVADDLKHAKSIQQQNKHNVDLKNAGVVTTATNLANATAVKSQLDRVKKILKPYQDELATKGVLQEEHRVAYEQLLAVQANLEALQVRVENKDQEGLRALEDKNTIRWGDKVATGVTIHGNGSATVIAGTTGPAALGLVGINYVAQTGGLNPGKVQGEEEDSKSSTRVFGRNFDIDGADGNIVAQNSYKGVDRVVLTDGNTNYGNVPDTATLAQAHAAFTTAAAAKRDSIKYTLAAKPLKLGKVQYGRVTGNLDPVTLTAEQLKQGGTFYSQANYLNKGDAKAVDYYFYRGVDATTVEEMKALPKGKELTYYGHALMYGIDNNFHGGIAGQVPNAFGDGGMIGLGNFVVANVNLDSNRVKGAVYNVWQDKASGAIAPDNLVAFDGNIHGNSVLGEAQRVYNKSDKADFRASFFGSDAAEMGGSFNSTTWQERYGAKGDVWGGVFGAKTDITVDPLTNQWLGDIPDLTKPNN